MADDPAFEQLWMMFLNEFESNIADGAEFGTFCNLNEHRVYRYTPLSPRGYHTCIPTGILYSTLVAGCLIPAPSKVVCVGVSVGVVCCN